MIINGTLQYKDEFAARWMQDWLQSNSFVLDKSKQSVHLYLYAVQDIDKECELDLTNYTKGDKVILVLPYEGSLRHLDKIYNKFIEKYPQFPSEDLYLSTEILNYKTIEPNKYNFLNLFAIDKWRKYSKFAHSHNFDDKVKDFISYNRSPKHHRYQLIAELQINNILDKGFVSFNPNFNDEVPFMLTSLQFCESDPYLPNDKKELYKPYIQEYFWIDPYNIKLPQDSTQDDLRTKRFLESMISVVTESNWYEPEIFFTEKIYSPIAYKHAFILLGPPFSLQKLRELGFKTFDGIIDESYDSTVDHYERLQKVVAEIKKFCNLDLNTKQEVWEKLNSIAEYNFNYFWSNEYENRHSELLQFLKKYRL
jgi:hypothetical protein